MGGSTGDALRDRLGRRDGDSRRGNDRRYAGGYRHYDHVCDRRCGHGRHYSHRCDNSCRHRRYYYDCPYGPVVVPVYVPVPGPVVVYEPPPTEVVIVPRAPEPAPSAPDRTPVDRVAGPMPLEQVIANVEEAWVLGDLVLLMQHVSPDQKVEIYQQGALLYSLTRGEFRQRNEDAFARYKTLEMRFDRPEVLSDTEAVASGIHVFRDEQGEERRVRVIYAFRNLGRTWWVVGVDFSREGEEPAAGPAPDEPVADPDAVRNEPGEAGPEAEIRDVTLLWARKIRLGDLLAQSQPLRIATLRYRVGADDATYDLEAMRGIAPGTLAWALYHRGEETPVETGAVDAKRIDTRAWVSVEALSGAAAEPVLVSADGRKRKAVTLPLRWIAPGHALLLEETAAPTPKPSRAVKPAKKPAPTAKVAKRTRVARR